MSCNKNKNTIIKTKTNKKISFTKKTKLLLSNSQKVGTNISKYKERYTKN